MYSKYLAVGIVHGVTMFPDATLGIQIIFGYGKIVFGYVEMFPYIIIVIVSFSEIYEWKEDLVETIRTLIRFYGIKLLNGCEIL